MNKKELAYFINSISENYINEAEDVAVRMNCKLLFSLKELNIISNECYSKCYFLVETNEASDIFKAKEILEAELDVLPEKSELDVDVILEDFTKTYDVILNDNSLTSSEKLDKLKAYYFTFVRDVAKEIKFLKHLQELILKQEQEEEGTDVILLDFNSYVQQFYK